jgi:hypothetical protein
MVSKNASMQHLRGGQHQVRNCLFDNPALCARRVTVVDGNSEAVFRCKVIVPGRGHTELGEFTLFLRKDCQGMAVPVDADALIQGQQSHHTTSAASGKGEARVMTLMQKLQHLPLGLAQVGDALSLEQGAEPGGKVGGKIALRWRCRG